MSGSNFEIRCGECGREGYLEIYTDGWQGVAINSDHIICDDCEIKAHPEIYFDHQCKDCGKWWNKRDGHTFELGSDGVWMCYTCARALAAKIMAESLTLRPHSDG